MYVMILPSSGFEGNMIWVEHSDNRNAQYAAEKLEALICFVGQMKKCKANTTKNEENFKHLSARFGSFIVNWQIVQKIRSALTRSNAKSKFPL